MDDALPQRAQQIIRSGCGYRHDDVNTAWKDKAYHVFYACPMPLRTDIDDYVLGEAVDAEGRYMYLLDPAGRKFVAGARYTDARGYLELIDLVADGYGPTLFLLLMQKARREGRPGVAPDLGFTSDDAKRMNARFYAEPPPGVTFTPNGDAEHPEVYLNQIYRIGAALVPEARARANAERHFDPQTDDRWHTEAGVFALLQEYLTRSEVPQGDRP
jgi:hypothetical protein